MRNLVRFGLLVAALVVGVGIIVAGVRQRA